MTNVLIKKRKFGYGDRHAQREDNVKTQGECLVSMKVAACQGERLGAYLSLMTFTRNLPHQPLDFGLTASGNNL